MSRFSRDEDDDYVDVECYDIVTCTDDAVLVSSVEANEKVWIPKSQLSYEDRERVEGIIGKCTISVRRWFAEKKDLI